MAKDAELFVPAEDRENSIINFFNLSRIEPELGWGQEQDKPYSLNLEEKTRLSPKQIIYPQSEDLLDFSYQKNMEQLDDVEISIAPSKTDGKQIIFGLKPCDVQGIARLDAVFGEGW
ncbi:MAG: hypothetical protein U5N58_08945 [Actinomycetota bacterium]|nr:hypothetical protein [Actinomycetota bacterium]